MNTKKNNLDQNSIEDIVAGVVNQLGEAKRKCETDDVKGKDDEVDEAQASNGTNNGKDGSTELKTPEVPGHKADVKMESDDEDDDEKSETKGKKKKYDEKQKTDGTNETKKSDDEMEETKKSKSKKSDDDMDEADDEDDDSKVDVKKGSAKKDDKSEKKEDIAVEVDDADLDLSGLAEALDISEADMDKISVIFKAAVADATRKKIAETVDRLNTESETALAEKIESIQETFDAYTSEYAAKWAQDNAVNLYNGLRLEALEDYVDAQRKVFLEHNIVVPEDRIDAFDELAKVHESTKTQLDATIKEKSVALAENVKLKKASIVAELTAEMTLIDRERFETMVEEVTLTTESKFRDDAGIILEKFFDGDTVEDDTVVELSEHHGARSLGVGDTTSKSAMQNTIDFLNRSSGR